MISSGRRTFIKQALALGAFSFLPNSIFGQDSSFPFQMSLNPGAIGVNVGHDELVELALKYGFQAITPLPELVQKPASELQVVKEAMKDAGLQWDAMGLPVEFRKSNDQFRKELYNLHSSADMLQNIGGFAMNTWIMPMHNELDYDENFDLHVERLTEVAKVLAASGLSLGFEYVGPISLMSTGKYPFVSKLFELQELIRAINAPNVGIQLDAFHWYCAGESADDLGRLSAKEIITVDLNDAVAGRSIFEQLDWERELPGASGVIDLKTFLKALAAMGYTGPIRAEPFNAQLNALDNETAVQRTAEAMSQTLALVND